MPSVVQLASNITECSTDLATIWSLRDIRETEIAILEYGSFYSHNSDKYYINERSPRSLSNHHIRSTSRYILITCYVMHTSLTLSSTNNASVSSHIVTLCNWQLFHNGYTDCLQSFKYRLMFKHNKYFFRIPQQYSESSVIIRHIQIIAKYLTKIGFWYEKLE